MVLLIIIPMKWLFHWEYTLFSDKPICRRAVILLEIVKTSLQTASTSQDLNQWGGFQRDHKKIEGLVKIKPLGFAGLHVCYIWCAMDPINIPQSC